MRTVMRPRYYCDHCKKANGSPSAMKRHERGCTANPSRQCGVCGFPTDYEKLIPIAMSGDIKALEESAEGCPACMLAAIRLAPWTTSYADENGPEHKDIPDAIRLWDFKPALKEWWDNVNAARYESESHECY
jgi:hypothetical protein